MCGVEDNVDESTKLFYLQKVGERMGWSGWNESHVGWVREQVSLVPVTESIQYCNNSRAKEGDWAVNN